MSTVRQQQGVYTIQTDDTIEVIALDKPKAQFRKLWIYPGAEDAASTTTGLTTNGNPVYIGIDADGSKLTPDILNPNDLPLLIQLPENANETMLLKDIIIRGKAGDSVFFKYWP
jgi:hypothetical protein